MLPTVLPRLLAVAVTLQTASAAAADLPADPGFEPLRRSLELRAAGDAAGAARALAPAKPGGALCGDGLLEPWCAWHRGEALFDAGDPAGAADAFRRARELDPDGPAAARSLPREADARLNAADPAEGVALARGLLARSPSPELRAKLATALLRSGQREQARAEWRRIYLENPEHPAAREASDRLAALGGVGPLGATEHVARSARLLATGFKSAAVESARAALAAAKSPAEVAAARVALGRALWKSRVFDEAERVLAAVGPGAPAPLRLQAMDELGRSALARNEFDLASERLTAVAREFPNAPEADEAAFLGAWSFFNAREFARCATAFDGFVEGRRRSKRADEALWYAGFCRQMTGDGAGARKAYEALERMSDRLAPQAAYWRARLTSDPAAAETLYRRAIRIAPLGWYAWLARERLAEMKAAPEPLPWTAAAPTAPEIAGERERRAVLLAALGLRREAREELAAAEHAPAARPAAKTAALWASIGFHDRAYRVANARLWADGYERRDPEALALLFPRAYESEVVPASAAVGLDPYFAWAIMRRESAFDPTARSIARAHGLMQLLATNARKVAAVTGEPIPGLADLQRPSGIVPLAAWYLADLTGRFGHVALGAAAYNGGADNVARWVASFGDSPLDQFVELVPFKETRLYVKGVVGDYFAYRALYRADSPALPFPAAIPPCGPNGAF